MEDVFGLAVSHKNVSFSYEKGSKTKNILDNVNIAVPRGTIYALLGPSGCGKTTLLKVTTGRIRSKKVRGEVRVFGEDPNQPTSFIPGPGIGYMPQEIALHDSVTVKETLWLFGKLNLMKKKLINERVEKLRKILDLPPDHKIVDHLSGGQRRRVSLAIALLHNPPLLILDEPTVGVDPLLRKQIWSHLVQLTSTRKTTIIITTHYIEEAKDADIIGAMRHGRILVEASPSVVMKTFNDNNLDSCFAKLCYEDNYTSEYLNQMTEETKIRRAESNLTVLTDLDSTVTDTNAVVTQWPEFNLPKPRYAVYRSKVLFKMSLILIRRNKINLFFKIGIPVVTIILYCLCMGGDLFDVPLVVANEEISGNGTSRMSDKFIRHLDRGIVTIQNSTFDDAYNLVKEASVSSFIHINSNFSQCFHQRLELGLDADNETIQCGQISAYFDMTNQIKYYELYRSFVQSYQSFFEEFLISKNKTPSLATIPIDMTRTIYGSLDVRAGEFMVSGIILIISHFMATSFVVLTMIVDKMNGLDERMWVSGVTKRDVLLSSYATETLVGIIQACILMVCVFYIFSFPLHGSLVLLTVLTLGQGFVGLSFGYFVSSIMTNSAFALVAIVFWMFANLLVSGLIWPLNSAPQIVRKIVEYLPLTLPNEAFKAIMSKGWGLNYLVVNLGFISTIVWFLLYVGLTVISLKYLN